MHHITIYTIGTPKEQAVDKLLEKYVHYLKSFAKIHFIALKGSNSTDLKKVIKEESEHLAEKRTPGTISILLTEHGKAFSSLAFAEQIEKWSQHGSLHLAFYIAGPFGVTKDLANAFDATLSLSQMTFPHEISLILLLEQIYRAETILHGKTYHY